MVAGHLPKLTVRLEEFDFWVMDISHHTMAESLEVLRNLVSYTHLMGPLRKSQNYVLIINTCVPVNRFCGLILSPNSLYNHRDWYNTQVVEAIKKHYPSTVFGDNKEKKEDGVDDCCATSNYLLVTFLKIFIIIQSIIKKIVQNKGAVIFPACNLYVFSKNAEAHMKANGSRYLKERDGQPPNFISLDNVEKRIDELRTIVLKKYISRSTMTLKPTPILPNCQCSIAPPWNIFFFVGPYYSNNLVGKYTKQFDIGEPKSVMSVLQSVTFFEKINPPMALDFSSNFCFYHNNTSQIRIGQDTETFFHPALLPIGEQMHNVYRLYGELPTLNEIFTAFGFALIVGGRHLSERMFELLMLQYGEQVRIKTLDKELERLPVRIAKNEAVKIMFRIYYQYFLRDQSQWRDMKDKGLVRIRLDGQRDSRIDGLKLWELNGQNPTFVDIVKNLTFIQTPPIQFPMRPSTDVFDVGPLADSAPCLDSIPYNNPDFAKFLGLLLDVRVGILSPADTDLFISCARFTPLKIPDPQLLNSIPGPTAPPPLQLLQQMEILEDLMKQRNVLDGVLRELNLQ